MSYMLLLNYFVWMSEYFKHNLKQIVILPNVSDKRSRPRSDKIGKKNCLFSEIKEKPKSKFCDFRK